jgi:hypothetical protein
MPAPTGMVVGKASAAITAIRDQCAGAKFLTMLAFREYDANMHDGDAETADSETTQF